MLKNAVIKILRKYKTMSLIWPMVPIPFAFSGCKFYPTCGDYAIQAVDKHGVFKGVSKAILRILKCNPLSHGGLDLP